MKKEDQVDHTVLGTVGPCILKSISLGLNNTALQHSKQKGIDSFKSLPYLLHMYRGLICIHTLADLWAYNLVWVFEYVHI